MIELKSYRDLTVWQKSMDLVVICYQLTSLFPKTEIDGLSSQIQRAAVSIPANIAEGKGRNHLGDYIRHLYYCKWLTQRIRNSFDDCRTIRLS
ncbi:four helix bundle protein [Cyanobacterium aponinum AL20118]|uniref:Four helix bundle protein n=1 Tax=Cyanobacterium aponinum AL20115 TaxID=3090662 RepID=A0AAF1C2Y6_9CHRO|nr:four helix bundle protein [Cyanobacterium aponinum]WPF89198.1 four helix bundle protein [Cyanobacterium aponinum AL20115]